MNEQPSPVVAPPSVPPSASIAPRSSWKKKALIVTGIVFGTATLTIAGTAWWVKRNIYASPFTPVALSATEQSALDQKLAVLKQSGAAEAAPVDPEVAKRTLTITDREINAFLEQQGLGEQVKVSLHHGGGTATFLLPMSSDGVPNSGPTLRISVSLGAKMDENKKFALSISDVSVGGVPLPNAWLGNMKGLNMLADAPISDDPALKAFAAGIRDFSIRSGQLSVVLNE
ncbi:MAG: hypothetical protein JNM99_23865 [Verrucomicrobiaceae bacterium]|nr:hypothetical protein [Verrucomicrobiaceae bacterium]